MRPRVCGDALKRHAQLRSWYMLYVMQWPVKNNAQFLPRSALMSRTEGRSLHTLYPLRQPRLLKSLSHMKIVPHAGSHWSVRLAGLFPQRLQKFSNPPRHPLAGIVGRDRVARSRDQSRQRTH